MGYPAFYFCAASGPGGRWGMSSPSSDAAPAIHPAAAAVPGPVLFFDGECGLCQRLVRLLLRLDHGGRLRFARLQGPCAQAYLRAHGLPTMDFDTLIYVPEWGRRDRPEYLVRTAGVIGALRSIGTRATRALAAAIAVFPTAWRDAGYRAIGRARHRIFGPWRPRPLPRPEWAARFLD